MTILASTVSVKTMSDDTLRLTIDIEPRHAQAAFALFGQRGSPCVIARLTPEAATASARAETVAADTVKGGDLARLAGRLCNNPEFQAWMCCDDAASAAQMVRSICGVRSRAEIDHNETARRLFHDKIRKPFAELCRVGGGAYEQ